MGRSRLVVGGVVAATVVLLAGVGLRAVLRDAPGQPPQGLSGEAFRGVVLGVDQEALTERFAPIRPVQLAKQERRSRPADTLCLHYPSDERADDVVYRFCFQDDRLVDKAVVRRDG
jgi:hypothetical protein